MNLSIKVSLLLLALAVAVTATSARLKCGPGSPRNCSIQMIKLKGPYTPGGLLKVTHGLDVRKSTQRNSCPRNWKIFAPTSVRDWATVKGSTSFPKSPHLIVDVTRPKRGCGGCTRAAMNSSSRAQRSWRTTDGAKWFLRSTRYSEPNGDYHANCYLHVYKTTPNDVKFNDLNCSYHSNSYLCQPVKGRAPVNGRWSRWSKCSKKCGNGVQTRKCSPPKFGGRMCSGKTTRKCMLKKCNTATQVSFHVRKLIKKIQASLVKENKKFKKTSADCVKWLKVHKTSGTKGDNKIAKLQAEIKETKKMQKSIQNDKLPAAIREGKRAQNQQDSETRAMAKGDKTRKRQHSKFRAKVAKLNKHLAFVKHLYVWLMGTKVERRRSVKFLEAKAKEAKEHSKRMSGQSAVMMETAAKMLTRGHLDAIYKLLDNLRARIQQSIRRATRKELSQAKAWIREYARLRTRQIGFHKVVTKNSLKQTKLSYKNALGDQTVERNERVIETTQLSNAHHERDLQVLKLRCSRNKIRHTHAVADFKSETKTLKAVLVKVSKGKAHMKFLEEDKHLGRRR